MAGLLICLVICLVIKVIQPNSFIRRLIHYDIEAIKEMPSWYARDRTMLAEDLKDYFTGLYEDYGFLAPLGAIYDIIWFKKVQACNWFERVIRTIPLVAGVVLIVRPGVIKTLIGIGCIIFWTMY